MDIQTIKDTNIADLLNGYVQQMNVYVCIWCNAEFESVDEAQAHIKGHTPEDRFEILMNADSLISYSTLEYWVLMEMFRGKEPIEISEELQINPSSVRGARQNFFNETARAKIVLMLLNLITDKQKPLRKYSRAVGSDEVQLKDQKLAVDEDNRVTALYNITELHRKPIKHATTLILLTDITAEGDLLFLCVDKARKSYGKNIENRHLWDCMGTHLGASDVLTISDDKGVIGTKLQAEHFRNAAIRDLEETLRVAHLKIDPSQLAFMFTDEYQGTSLYGAGINHEITDVFSYRIDTSRNIKVWDEYIDSLGGRVKKQFRMKKMSYIELLAEYKAGNLMDGLARVVTAFEQDQSYLERIKAVF
ncbi:MAG: hypothetical protein FWH40_01190 [Coriobacteriia bacterium]|nr:hypothetical protein [Coriobacteriia bacterium]